MAHLADAGQVLEGTWREVSRQAASVPPEQQVRLELVGGGNAPGPAKAPNRAMLDAMRAADEAQRGMSPAPDSDGVALIREARAGAMWGLDAGE